MTCAVDKNGVIPVKEKIKVPANVSKVVNLHMSFECSFCIFLMHFKFAKLLKMTPFSFDVTDYEPICVIS